MNQWPIQCNAEWWMSTMTKFQEQLYIILWYWSWKWVDQKYNLEGFIATYQWSKSFKSQDFLTVINENVTGERTKWSVAGDRHTCRNGSLSAMPLFNTARTRCRDYSWISPKRKFPEICHEICDAISPVTIFGIIGLDLQFRRFRCK